MLYLLLLSVSSGRVSNQYAGGRDASTLFRILAFYWFFCHPGVCQRVARCRCSENIPDDILTEILSQQVRDIHHAKRKEGTKDEISLLIFSGVGCCGLGGGVEGLGWIRSSTRGNTVPGEERGWTEVVEPLTILLTILFCFRLSYTQPFRHSVVDGDGVYTGEDRVAKDGKIQQVF